MNRTLAGTVAALGCLLAAPAAHAYTTPFGAAAPWNRPAARSAVDPDSARLVGRLWCGTGCGRRDGAENLHLTTHDYSFPVYYAAAATGSCPVRVRNAASGSNLAGARVPCDPAWKPSTGRDWDGAPGVDAQMIVLDAATGREWDLWQYGYRSGVVTVSNGNLVRDKDGRVADYRTKTDGFRPSRGSGIQYLAMLPVPDEVRQGAVRHAMPLLLPNDGTAVRAPATKSDPEAVPGGVPTGTRFALRVSDADIAGWLDRLPPCVSAMGRTSLRVLAVALRDYGLVVTDHAGSAHVQLADVANPATRTAWGGLGLATQTCSNGKQYPRDALDGLLSQARLVALAPGGG